MYVYIFLGLVILVMLLLIIVVSTAKSSERYITYDTKEGSNESRDKF